MSAIQRGPKPLKSGLAEELFPSESEDEFSLFLSFLIDAV
jgi:hypothetical protein